ncbi:hypothetical protein, partial [Sulfoacidibacillus thermotolerans]|uniref:hypothetical protein n=1 Tax=Sulfoacidibacillus thermotolerans TaxID=1765684 RepID=UPI001C62AF77
HAPFMPLSCPFHAPFMPLSCPLGALEKNLYWQGFFAVHAPHAPFFDTYTFIENVLCEYNFSMAYL